MTTPNFYAEHLERIVGDLSLDKSMLQDLFSIKV